MFSTLNINIGDGSFLNQPIFIQEYDKFAYIQFFNNEISCLDLQ